MKKETKTKKPTITKEEAELAKSRELCDKIAGVLSGKKALNVTGIKVDHLTVIADYFLIASSKATTGVKALANAVDEALSKQDGIEPRRKEGLTEGRWVAMDYGTVIVHIFHEEARSFYQLERLWTDGLNLINYD